MKPLTSQEREEYITRILDVVEANIEMNSGYREFILDAVRNHIATLWNDEDILAWFNDDNV